MSVPGPYCHAEAFIENDGQVDWIGDGVLCQLVTVMMVDDTGEVEPAVGVFTAEQARSLAFELLMVAEHADQLTRPREENR
jgi:hypothetical protein